MTVLRSSSRQRPVKGEASSLYETVISVLDSMDYRYQSTPGPQSQIRFINQSVTTEIDYHVIFLTDESESLIVSYAAMPIAIPEEKRSLVAEYMIRVNFGARFETLEMDFETGEFRVRTSMIIDGGRLSADMVKQMLFGPMNWMDQNLPKIWGVAMMGLSPEEALAGG